MEISNHLNIPDIEKENINLLAQIFSALTNGNASLHVVGGAIKKLWPRKDIDITITMPAGRGGTELERAGDRLNMLERLVDDVQDSSNGYFKKHKTIRPYIDAQFDSNDILAHAGSVMIKPEKGTMIEVVPIS